MTEHTLTPYDTGARLEPQLWPLRGPDSVLDPDRYGKVDFDDDASVTQLTLHVERAGFADPESSWSAQPLYALRLETNGDEEPLAITVDGDPAVVLTDELLEGIRELTEWAQRGWERFGRQARTTGDYGLSEIDEARERYTAARATVRALTDIKETTP